MEGVQKKPCLSIVMPLYNSERTVAKTLDAILNNTFKNFEVVIVNDGSTDHSAEIIKNYPIRIFHQENSGPSRARNFGTEKARADIIVFIDSDVIIPDFTLQRLHDAFGNNKDVEIIGGMPDSINHYKNKISDYENLYIHYQFHRQKNTTTAFYTSLVAIKKELFQKFNGFDERIRIPEDMELGQRLLNDGHIIYLDKDIQFSHLNHFTLIGYIKKQIKKTAGILKIKLRDMERKVVSKKCYDAGLFFQLGVPMSLLIPLGVVSSLFFMSMPIIYFSLAVFLFLILVNQKMLFFFYKKRNLSFLIASCFILVFNFWMYAVGFFYGMTTFALGKKY